MTQTDLQKILKVLDEQNIDRDIKHEEFVQSIAVMQEQLAPIYKIYSQFSGFGDIAMGFFKWVIIPSSVVIGIFLSLRQLIK